MQGTQLTVLENFKKDHRGWEEMDMESSEDLQGSKNTLHDTIIADTCHYTLSKLKGRIIPTTNPNVKYGLGVIML